MGDCKDSGVTINLRFAICILQFAIHLARYCKMQIAKCKLIQSSRFRLLRARLHHLAQRRQGAKLEHAYGAGGAAHALGHFLCR